MKAILKNVPIKVALIAAITLNSSCATIFGGQVSDHQRARPKKDRPKRKIRPVPFIADILLPPFGWVGLIVDFSTGAIYKPKN